MMFTSLFNLVGQSLGLGLGRDGACHLIKIGIEDLLPRDVETGKMNVDYNVFAFDYGNHVGFVVKLGSSLPNRGDATECVCYDYPQLVAYLTTQCVKQAPVIEEDDKIDDAIAAMREEAMRELEIEPSDDDDDYEEDESYDDDVDIADDVEPVVEEVEETQDDAGVTEEVVEEDDEPLVLTLEKPKGKPGSAKYTKALQDMAQELLSLVDVDDIPEEIVDALPDILGEAFKDFDSFEYDTSEDLLEFFSDYVQFDDEE